MCSATTPTFHRVAVVNRGEPAMRFLNAVAELNEEADGAPLTTVAVYTEPDRQAWFVRAADEAVCIGPATVFDERTGPERQSYLDYERLARALVDTGVDAVWAGWGFVAEHAEFADLCDKLDIVFIGPTGDAMRLAGDKVRSKRLAERVGVPVVPWCDGPVSTATEASA
ncbi:MAG TPA: biotin carboxylase N-terminal domain-containing protein, partial [Pseudonocardiaceae bacterium]